MYSVWRICLTHTLTLVIGIRASVSTLLKHCHDRMAQYFLYVDVHNPAHIISYKVAWLTMIPDWIILVGWMAWAWHNANAPTRQHLHHHYHYHQLMLNARALCYRCSSLLCSFCLLYSTFASTLPPSTACHHITSSTSHPSLSAYSKKYRFSLYFVDEKFSL